MEQELITVIENCGLEVEDVKPILDAAKRTRTDKVETVQQATINLRQAIQDAEMFGLVRTQNGAVITGAMASAHGVVLT